jgi:23S rRNA (pseudouridine1915-N3)-methyltransferase
MVIHLLAVGRVRHAALRAACEDYLARARRYFRLEVHEVPDATRGGRTGAEAREREGAALLRALPAGVPPVALTRAGREDDSARLARRLGEWQRLGRDIALVLGGAGGLSPAVLERCSLTLRLSALTLPHELARLVLLEQLYRAGTILRGQPYHKGAP